MIEVLDNILQSLEVGGKEEAIAQEPMAPSDRLSALEMRVAGHYKADFGLGARDNNLEKGGEVGFYLGQLFTDPQALVYICERRCAR